MAFVAIGCCFVCRGTFTFNPERVPSIRVDGHRQPVCRNCMDRANAVRKERGLEPHAILPGAYDAQGEETDSDWEGENK